MPNRNRLLFQATELDAHARRFDEIATEASSSAMVAQGARALAAECRRTARRLRERAEERAA
ncbi:hypothetical protein L6R50_08960 [Myxococcota bacterium]|nr:hypothetical protein [Myxococcota bacterium]